MTEVTRMRASSSTVDAAGERGQHDCRHRCCGRFVMDIVAALLASRGWRCAQQADRVAKGLQSEALVESVDVAPTLLEATGLPVPESMQGRSLLSQLEGRADPHRHKDCVVAEFKDSIGGPAHNDHSHGSMVFDGHYKSAVYHGHRIGELYGLQNDPGEFDNLWDDPAARELKAERIRAHLDAMMATVSAGPPRSVAY